MASFILMVITVLQLLLGNNDFYNKTENNTLLQANFTKIHVESVLLVHHQYVDAKSLRLF